MEIKVLARRGVSIREMVRELGCFSPRLLALRRLMTRKLRVDGQEPDGKRSFGGAKGWRHRLAVWLGWACSPHPEGSFYQEMFRSDDIIFFNGRPRSAAPITLVSELVFIRLQPFHARQQRQEKLSGFVRVVQPLHPPVLTGLPAS